LKYSKKKSERKFLVLDNHFSNETETKEKLFFLSPTNGRPSKFPKEVCGFLFRPSSLTPSSQILQVPLQACMDYCYDPSLYEASKNLRASIFSTFKSEQISSDLALLIIEHSLSPLKKDYSIALISKSMPNLAPKLLQISRSLQTSLGKNDSAARLFLFLL
jgi:hypothetical protein